MLHMFYQFLVASAFVFAAFCWDSSIRNGDTKKLNKLIRKASSVLATPPEPLEVTVERKIVQKLLTILDNRADPLHNLLQKQQSFVSWSLVQLCCNKDYRKSFLLSAMSLFNYSSPWQGEETQSVLLRQEHKSCTSDLFCTICTFAHFNAIYVIFIHSSTVGYLHFIVLYTYIVVLQYSILNSIPVQVYSICRRVFYVFFFSVYVCMHVSSCVKCICCD